VNTPASLETARTAFNAYVAEHVSSSLGLGPEAIDRLGFAEAAARIPESVVRTRYVELAINLLEANINEHRALAKKTEPDRSSSLPTVAALVGAAVALVVRSRGCAAGCGSAFLVVRASSENRAARIYSGS